MKKKVALLVLLTLTMSMTGCNIAYESELETNEENETISDADIVIDFCYTDETYKEYFEFCEKEFEKQNKDVDIILHCQKENMEYLADNILEVAYIIGGVPAMIAIQKELAKENEHDGE